MTDDMVPALTDILGDEDKAKEIVEAGKASMGNLTFSYCMSKLKYSFDIACQT